MGRSDGSQYRKWFSHLLVELANVADEGAFFGDAVRIARRPFVVRTWTRVSGCIGGWYAVVGRVGATTLEVWLDRYSDRDGDPHLGVWIEGQRPVIQRARNVLGDLPSYGKEDRDADGFLDSAARRMARGRIGQLVVDDWGRGAPVWVGGYVKASPYRMAPADSLGLVVSLLRVLHDALHPSQSPKRELQERYWELITRLARPNQPRFRAELLGRHTACAISGCTERVLLDAAHIVPLRNHTADDLTADDADNGLLLRADLHRLFDADLLTIAVGARPRVLLRAALGSDYDSLLGREVTGLSIAQQSALRIRNARLAREGWSELRRDP